MDKNNQSKKSKGKGKKVIIGLLVIVIIAVLALFGLKLYGNNNQLPEVIIDSPIGNFVVSGEQQQQTDNNANVSEEIPSITFAGYGRYEVSEDSPLVELKNPEGNFVNMVFTLTDKASGEIIARTNPVSAGEFVYVNVFDFYKAAGTYNVEVVVSTYDSETNQPMNGINQNMEIIIK